MRLDDGRPIVTGNTYDKFRTRNPVARWLQSGFLGAARQLLSRVSALGTPRSVLEIGCGPGDLAAEIVPPEWPYVGLDIGLDEVRRMRAQVPAGLPLLASADRLPLADRSFDLVIACEVLEHLERPETAVEEIARVSDAGLLLLSVPWEPVWRLLNLMRGAYVGQLGNTPGHLQHFSRRTIRDLVGRRFEVIGERRPLPWTLLLARLR